MEFKDLAGLIKQKKQTIFIITVLFFLLTSLITFAQPLKYRATTRLLVVQEGTAGSDVYSISRSNKFLSSILAEVVYSNSFFEQVLESDYNIDKSVFSLELNKRMKEWRKMISSTAVSDTGMLVIDTYSPSKYQANQINQAIAYTLKTKHSVYHGLQDKVAVKVIDRTTLSNWPVKPNIILNIIFGILFGFVASLGFVKIFPQIDLRVFRARVKKNRRVAQAPVFKTENEEYLEEESRESGLVQELEPVLATNDNEEILRETSEENFDDNNDKFNYIKEEELDDNEEDSENNFRGNINNVF